MNIAYIINNLQYAGAETYILNLLNYYVKRVSFSNISLILLRNDSNSTLLNRIPSEVNLYIFNVKKLRNIFSNYIVIKNINKILLKNNIDLIHTNLLWGDLFGSIAARSIPNCKVISTEHNTNRYRINYTKSDLIDRLLDKIRLKYTDMIIMISNKVGNYFMEKTLFSPKKAKVIYHGIDIANFTKNIVNPLPVDSEKINIALIGRMSTQKGHLFLIDIIKQLNQKNKFHFYFAGEGILRNKIEKMIANLKLEKYITLLGIVKDIPSLLSQMDAIIMPSLWEGFGIVAIEAGAFKKPVIANKIDGLKEIIIHKRTGLLLPYLDKTKWIETIDTLDKNTLRNLGNNSYTRISNFFNIELMAKKTYSCYNELVQNESPTKYKSH